MQRARNASRECFSCGAETAHLLHAKRDLGGGWKCDSAVGFGVWCAVWGSLCGVFDIPGTIVGVHGAPLRPAVGPLHGACRGERAPWAAKGSPTRGCAMQPQVAQARPSVRRKWLAQWPEHRWRAQ